MRIALANGALGARCRFRWENAVVLTTQEHHNRVHKALKQTELTLYIR